MTPRLAVTQEQAATVRLGVDGLSASRCVLRLPERPTMLGESYHHVRAIPEGTRVRIEYPCDVCLGHGRRWRNGRPDGVRCSCDNGSVPVAFATLTSVDEVVDRDDATIHVWYVTLSDITVEAR